MILILRSFSNLNKEVQRSLLVRVPSSMDRSANVFYRFSVPLLAFKGLPSVVGLHRLSTASAAVGEAAYETLLSLYPQQKEMFDLLRRGYFQILRHSFPRRRKEIRKGIKVGQIVASTILKDRINDGSELNVTYIPILEDGFHRVDPTHPSQSYLNPGWGRSRPFVIHSVGHFRSPDTLGVTPGERLLFLNSSVYSQCYEEVKSLGSLVSSSRTAEESEVAFFWAYDGGPKIGTAPRLFNPIVHLIARQQNNSFPQNAHLLGLVHFALADVTMTTWETKYFDQFWRPIVAIRNGSPGKVADVSWTPLGAPADGRGDNFTPNFPSFVSGHASLASATFEILRRFYRRDRIPFQFQSDEFNGKTIDSLSGLPRPAVTRHFHSFTQAEMEIFHARIFLGIHWRIDQQYGLNMGTTLAKTIFNKLN